MPRPAAEAANRSFVCRIASRDRILPLIARRNRSASSIVIPATRCATRITSSW